MLNRAFYIKALIVQEASRVAIYDASAWLLVIKPSMVRVQLYKEFKSLNSIYGNYDIISIATLQTYSSVSPYKEQSLN